MRIFAGIGALLLLCSVARADGSLTLHEAITRALAHSPEVAIAEENASYAESKLGSARWGFFHPELRVSAGENAFTGTPRAGVQVSQDLVRFLTLNGDEVRQASRDLEIARQRLAIVRQQVIRQVVEALNHLRLSEEGVRVNAEAVSEQKKLFALAQAQFDAGTGSAEHLLSVRQAMARAQHVLRQAEGERWQARIAFSQLLGDSIPARGEIP